MFRLHLQWQNQTALLNLFTAHCVLLCKLKRKLVAFFKRSFVVLE